MARQPPPAPGDTDTVPAMLTPGEYVIKRDAVKRIGVERLNQLNRGYRKGGLVGGYATGGEVSPAERAALATAGQYSGIELTPENAAAHGLDPNKGFINPAFSQPPAQQSTTTAASAPAPTQPPQGQSNSDPDVQVQSANTDPDVQITPAARGHETNSDPDVTVQAPHDQEAPQQAQRPSQAELDAYLKANNLGSSRGAQFDDDGKVVRIPDGHGGFDVYEYGTIKPGASSSSASSAGTPSTPARPPDESEPGVTSGQTISGTRTYFGLNPDGKTWDPEDNGRASLSGTTLNTRDPRVKGVAIPGDILNGTFGTFLVQDSKGGYSVIDSPAARKILQQVRSAHVQIYDEKGNKHAFPIIDVQGSLAGHPGKVIDFTWGAAHEMGYTDNGHIDYQILKGDGTPYPIPDLGKMPAYAGTRKQQGTGIAGTGSTPEYMIPVGQGGGPQRSEQIDYGGGGGDYGGGGGGGTPQGPMDPATMQFMLGGGGGGTQAAQAQQPPQSQPSFQYIPPGQQYSGGGPGTYPELDRPPIDIPGAPGPAALYGPGLPAGRAALPAPTPRLRQPAQSPEFEVLGPEAPLGPGRQQRRLPPNAINVPSKVISVTNPNQPRLTGPSLPAPPAAPGRPMLPAPGQGQRPPTPQPRPMLGPPPAPAPQGKAPTRPGPTAPPAAPGPPKPQPAAPPPQPAQPPTQRAPAPAQGPQQAPQAAPQPAPRPSKESNPPGFAQKLPALIAGGDMKAAAAEHALHLEPDDTRVRKHSTGDKLFKGTHFDPADIFHAHVLKDIPGNERHVISRTEEAIRRGEAMHLTYGSSPEKNLEGSPTSRRSREIEYEMSSPRARLVDAKANGPVRAQLSGHSMIPVAVGAVLKKEGQEHEGLIQGVSTHVLENNTYLINRELSRLGVTSPYPHGELNDKFVRDVEGYINNLKAGYRGTGTEHAIGTDKYPVTVDPNYKPHILTRAEADFINAAINNQGAQSKGKDTEGPDLRDLAEAAGTLLDRDKGEVNPIRQVIDMHHKRERMALAARPEHKANKEIQRAAKVDWSDDVLEPTIRTFKAGLVHDIHHRVEDIPEGIRPGENYRALTEALERVAYADKKERPDARIAAGFEKGGLVDGKPKRREIPKLSEEEYNELAGNIRKQFLSGKMKTAEYLDRMQDVPEPGEALEKKEEGFAKGGKVGDAKEDVASRLEREGVSQHQGSGGQAEGHAERLASYLQALAQAPGTLSSEKLDEEWDRRGHIRPQIEAEEKALIAHAKARGEYLEPMKKPVDAGGGEHSVWLDDDGQRVTKETGTMPVRDSNGDYSYGSGYGYTAMPDNPSEHLRPSTPYEYLKRIALAREHFGQETRLEGISHHYTGNRPMAAQGQPMPTIRTSEPRIGESQAPRLIHVHQYMTDKGWSANPNAVGEWHHPSGTVANDAHPNNFSFDDDGSVKPVDLMLRRDKQAAPKPETGQMRLPGFQTGGLVTDEGDQDPGQENLQAVRDRAKEKGAELDAYEHRGVIYLPRVVVPKENRSQGIGSSVMQDLIDHADRTGKRIALSPSTDFGGTSRSRLEQFYKRFGFVNNKGRDKDFTISESMVRHPKGYQGGGLVDDSDPGQDILNQQPPGGPGVTPEEEQAQQPPAAPAQPPQEPPAAGTVPPTTHTFKKVSPKEFITHRNRSAQATGKSRYLSELKPEDIAKHKLYTNQDNSAGVAVSPEGDVQNVFGQKGSGGHAVAHAIKNGGKTLDAYDGFLPHFYRQFGFHETGRMKFNPEFAHNWDPKDGTPDVVFMGLHPKGAEEGALDRVANKADKSKWIPNEHAERTDDDWDTQKERSKAFAQGTGTGGSHGASGGPEALARGSTSVPGPGAGTGRALEQPPAAGQPVPAKPAKAPKAPQKHPAAILKQVGPRPTDEEQGKIWDRVAKRLGEQVKGAIPLRPARKANGNFKIDSLGNPEYEQETNDYELANAPMLGKKALGYDKKGRVAKAPEGTVDKFDKNDLTYLNPTDRLRISHLDNVSAITAYADALGKEYDRVEKEIPDALKAKDWYNDTEGFLKEHFGSHADLVANLLAATSARTGVKTNYGFAMNAYHRYARGDYDRHIDLYNKAYEMKQREALAQHVLDAGIHHELPTSEAHAMALYIKHHDILPVQHDLDDPTIKGPQYGMNSLPVLKVLAQTWLDELKGPKTRRYTGNMTGRTIQSTGDMWVGRQLRRLGFEGHTKKPWLIQPEAEPGLSNLDFAIQELAHRRASEGRGLEPRQHQAILWTSEIKHWLQNGWSKGGDPSERDYRPMLKEYQRPEWAKRP